LATHGCAVELATDEFLEYPIKYNEAPGQWKVVAVSNKITSEANFKILEKEDAFNYNMDFLIQALCVKKVEEQGKFYFEILPGGKVIESF